jgi:2-deoxy-D-gluconate 3-dehydrogenase
MATAPQTAFITGASTGLGYAIACALARNGYDLAVADLDVKMFDRLLADSALNGPYFLSRAFAAHCIARKHAGSIVSLASTHGLTGLAGRSVYGISKGGMVQMTRMLAIEWATNDIRVNALAPSTVLTESRQKLLDAKMRATMLARIPTGKFVTTDDVAAAVVFLVSPGAASITGTTLPLDGGLVAN